MSQEQEAELKNIKQELKALIIEGLSLENVTPETIKDDEILFGEGLALDSLDAVEIVVLLQRKYGIEIKTMEQSKEIFTSIDTLARYIQEHRKK